MKIRAKRTEFNNDIEEEKVTNCTLHFNLRKPKSIVPTQIYAVLNIMYARKDSKQFKISLNCKVLPSNWNQRRQTIIVNGSENEETVTHLKNVLTIINNVNFVFLNYICIFATDKISDITIVNEIRNTINNNIKNMTENKNLLKPRGITASTVIKRAFHEYYEKGTKAEGTVKVNRDKVNRYLEYLKSGVVTDSARHRFTIEGLNEYRNYLHKQNPNVSQEYTYKQIELIAMLVNHAVANRTRDLGFSQIITKGFVKTDVQRDTRKDNKHFEVKEEELKYLQSLKLDKRREAETRDLFLFASTIGCRYSDLYNITKRLYSVKTDENGDKQLVYETQKGHNKHVEAFVPFSISPIIEETLRRIEADEFMPIGKTSGYFNNTLRNICKCANMNREIKYKDANGKEVCEPFHKAISSHCCRVSGATHLLRMYGNTDLVVKICGWRDDKMLKEVYGRLTTEDEVRNQSRRMNKAIEQMTTKQTQTEARNEVADYRDALFFLGADYAEVKDISSLPRLHSMLRKYEGMLLDKGIDCEVVKSIYNECLPYKERIEKLKAVCAEALQTT